ncbi:MAG: hypothetical protein ABI648_03755 [Betaproteobacteria bacterium]|jgi:hypothetical protein
MNKILATLLIAAALSSTGAFAADRSPGSIEDGKQRADSGVIGHDACIMLDQRIDCAAMPN